MMIPLKKIQGSEHYAKHMLSGKVLFIGLIALCLMIPGLMVKQIMLDRQQRSEEAKNSIHEMWSAEQHLIGPLIEVPYSEQQVRAGGGEEKRTRYLYLLPKELNIQATIRPEIRRLGIFETILYVSEIGLEGMFDASESVIHEGINYEAIDWRAARLVVSLSDPRGVNQAHIIGGEEHNTKTTFRIHPRNVCSDEKQQALSVPIEVESDEGVKFSLALELKGSENLSIAPVGEESNVLIRSDWHSPSFSGKFLPNHREINDDGFSANWKISGLSRGLPQCWSGSRVDFNQAKLAVKLLMPVGAYTQSLRVVTYAFLFVVFTFGAMFCAERISGLSIHLIQYLVSGVAIMIFYVLLLSLAEQMDFALAYGIATVVILLMIVSYIGAIIRRKSLTLALAGMLVLMYTYFFVVLQCEDYALLMGSVGLILIVSTVMYLTRDLHQRLRSNGAPETDLVDEDKGGIS